MTEKEKGVLQQRTFSIEWKIERFFADCEKFEDSYSSAVFPIRFANETTEWYLEIYPKGESEEKTHTAALYLNFNSEDVYEVTVFYRVSVLTEQNSLVELKKDAHTFKSSGDNWGWDDFVTHDFLNQKKNGVLINDTLTILCEITFSQLTDDVADMYQDYVDSIGKIGKGLADYEELLESGHFSDVTFKIQDKKMHLHKAILMCRNPVFKAMFQHEMKESTENVVEITDFDYEVMMELFRFIYAGKVNKIEEIAKDLLIAADKYSVTELKALCEQTLYHNLCMDNVIDYLKLTDTCDTIHLKTLAIKFAAVRYKDVINKPEFSKLSNDVMHQIMHAIAEKN